MASEAERTPGMAPDGEAWPCRTEPLGLFDEHPRLVAALYVLMRDKVQPGDLEQVMLHIRPPHRDTKYSNPHLHAYARSLAAYLVEE